MPTKPHINNYNAQQLGKDIRNLPGEHKDSPVWYLYLPPRWDHWTKDQIARLMDAYSIPAPRR